MESRTSCICCLIHSPDYDLKKPYTENEYTEIYADILKECFEINILSDMDDSYQGICTICVVRLRDALDFKHQVIRCQQHLRNVDKGFDVHDKAVIVANELSDSEIEQNNVEWLELVSEDEDVGSVGSPHPYKSDMNQGSARAIKDIEVNDKAPEPDEALGESDVGDAVWLVIFENESVRSISSSIPNRSETNQRAEDKFIGDDSRNGEHDEFEVKGESLPKYEEHDYSKFGMNGDKTQNNEDQLILKKLTDVVKFKENVQIVLKYSNCTPFFDKTIAGIVCMYCRELYRDIESLNMHISEKHDRLEVVYCKELYGGCLSIKLDITDLKCNICNVTLNFIADLKKHLTIEHRIEFYPINDYFIEFKLTDTDVLNCALCHSKFETFKTLSEHMNRHYRNYICDVCDLGFINRRRLAVHKKTHDVGDFKCSVCDKVFSTKVRQKSHETRIHNAAIRYTSNCPHCDKTFTSYYQRNRHMTTEHRASAATYKCNICDRFFCLKVQLTIHTKRDHLMERNHICVQCGSSFFRRRTLLEHMTLHNGDRVFKCVVCNKGFTTNTHLRSHMRIHNNDRRHKCCSCSMTFVQKRTLQSHMLSIHGILLSDIENPRSGRSRPGN